MNDKLYYTPPTDEQFEEIKEKAMDIWITYDDTYGYASEKIARIENLKNVRDNAMFIVAMFDHMNQAELSRMLSDDTRKAIADRIESGGIPRSYNAFWRE